MYGLKSNVSTRIKSLAWKKICRLEKNAQTGIKYSSYTGKLYGVNFYV